MHFGVLLSQRTADGIDHWGFTVNTGQERHQRLLINELSMLRLFIKKFREDHQPLFDHLYDNQINIAEDMGSLFYQQEAKMQMIKFPRNKFLKQLGILTNEEPLSRREREILQAILEGYTAKTIASQFRLSCRTVEFYTQRIREKLLCRSKEELIQKAKMFNL